MLLVGPPGCGKSWFLTRLLAALTAASDELIVFPLLDLKQVADPRALGRWFVTTVNVVNAKEMPLYALPPRIDNAPVLGDELKKICDHCGARHQIVLVDGLEEAAPAWRKEIVTFLTPILRVENVKIALTLRDEENLKHTPLSWDKYKTVMLDPLPTPEEQIERRLALIGPMPAMWPREPWEDELDGRIDESTEAEREWVFDKLKGHLTSNPYLNARLLALALEPKYLDEPPAALKRLCLERYLERAKLTAAYVAILERLNAIINAGGAPDGSFVGEEFGDHGPEAEQLDALQAAGIVTLISDSQRYKLDLAVAALI
jgi:hypothetical protein